MTTIRVQTTEAATARLRNAFRHELMFVLNSKKFGRLIVLLRLATDCDPTTDCCFITLSVFQVPGAFTPIYNLS